MISPQRYLTRAALRENVPAAALRELLLPSDDSARTASAHRLVWTLFGDTPDRRRDFLWREADRGVFYFLSARPPVDKHGLFEVEMPRVFAPLLKTGDRLAFELRANATIARSAGAGTRGARCDVVMNAIFHAPQGGRAAARREAVESAGVAWLIHQSHKSGFSLAASSQPATTGEGDEEAPLVSVTAYRTIKLDRPHASATLGVLDFAGILEVVDPVAFVEAVGRGFGRAKAFGCGLMLIRRA